MKILVTGGRGFIGSHLVDALVEKNHDVIVVDDCSANNDKFYYNPKATYHTFSIVDLNLLNKVAKDCDFCFHLAAESRLQEAILNPKRAVEVNVGGTLNVLESCKTNNIKGLIFSSTSSIYGLTEDLPITENTKENCLNPYASTKYAAELLIKNYVQLYGIKATILRYFNVFGERAPTKGQYALVTAIFLRQKKDNEALSIVGDGKQERDFIYVKDIVDANIACFDQWYDNKDINNGNLFNVGSGKSVSVLELAKSISDNIRFIPERLGEAKNNLCSIKKINSLVGWKPKTNILDWIKTQ